MEKGKNQVLLGSALVLENPGLDSPNSLDEVSELSEFSGTSSSIEIIENSSEEEQVDSIYFSMKDLMAQRRKQQPNWNSMKHLEPDP